MSTGHSIYNAYVIGDHVKLKDDWATFVYNIKPPWHLENVIMLIAGDVFQLCISTKRKQVLQPVTIKAKDMRVIFYINAILKVYEKSYNACT